MLTPLRERRTAAVIAVVGVSCLLVGAFFGGNLLTFVTGEYNGVGPGFKDRLLGTGTGITANIDSTVVINTRDPAKYVDSWASSVPWLETTIWQLTGRMWVEPDGSYSIYWSHHAGVLFNDGADFIEDQISDSPGATPAAFIALTMSDHAPAAGDHRLWNEITTNGLERTGGTYSSLGVGHWQVTHQFTASGDFTAVQAGSLCWSDVDASNSTTLCADTFAPVNLAGASSDKITYTMEITLS
jgi:hypothetical protein